MQQEKTNNIDINGLILKAESGDVKAQFELGEFYERQAESDKLNKKDNYANAIKWFTLSADNGYSKAQNALAGCYRYAIGVGKDIQRARELYFLAANNGDINAQKTLAWSYRYCSDGLVNKDLKQCEKWYLAAANQNDASAQTSLADIYKKNKNYADAVKWYKKSAENGYSFGQCGLANCYVKGYGVEKNGAEAVKWYSIAAEKDNVTATVRLAELLYKGELVAKNFDESIRLFKCAVELEGNRKEENGGEYIYWQECFKYLIEMLKNGTWKVSRLEDAKWIEKWFSAAGKDDIILAQYYYACFRFDGKVIEQNYNEAFKWLTECLEEYNLDMDDNNYDVFKAESRTLPSDLKKDVMLKLAMCYEKGLGTSQNKEKADALKKQAADVAVVTENNHTFERILASNQIKAKAGDVEALYSLALSYSTGRYVKQDYAKALELYEQAAKQGHSKSIHSLGQAYNNGWGVRKDGLKALDYFRQAAEVGNKEAQRDLAWNLYMGFVKQDYFEAYKWYEVLASGGDEKANEYLEKIRARLNTTEMFRYSQAVKLSEQGNLAAQYGLAECYECGIGTSSDIKLAITKYEEFLQKASDNRECKFEAILTCKKLSRFYKKGIGVIKDKNRAKEYKEQIAIIKNTWR